MPHIAPPATLPAGSIVDAYLRDSGGPRQDASTEQQHKEIRDYCGTYGLVIRRVYADVAKSGKTTAGRDEFNNLIDSTVRPEDRPRGIILWNYARFARELDDSTYYKSLLRKRNITVHSLTDNIPEGPYGRVVEFFIDISNEEKRRQTSKDAKRGLRELVQKHGCVPGVSPLGFKRQLVDLGLHRDGSRHTANRWVPDPELIPRIQRAFQLRAAGHTLRQIHLELGIYGALNSYKTFFANKIYIGILEFGDLVIENYCEPMIDMTTWLAVQERIHHYAELRATTQHPRRVSSPYVLSGLVYCLRCDSIMFGNTTTRDHIHGRDEAYRCSRSRRRLDCDASRIPRGKLEEAVITTLIDYILTPESLAALYEIEQNSVDHRESKRTQRLATIQAEKVKLSRQIVNITRAIAERGHTATLLDKLTELEGELSQIKLEITQLTAVSFAQHEKLDDDRLNDASMTIINAINSKDPQVSRNMIHSFIKKVSCEKIDGKIHGTITYFAPFPESEIGNNGGEVLPKGFVPVGAPLYRQLFTHPIMSRRTTCN